MLELFGHKSLAALDIWSIEHFFTGANMAVFGSKVRKKFNVNNDNPNLFSLAIVLILELFWEITEHYLEAGALTIFPRVQYWFQGVECFANRAITDPLITVAGGFFIIKYPKWRLFCCIFSAVWVITHVFFFPHSMYLQDWLIAKFKG